MTTIAAAALYASQHLYLCEGLPTAVFNPHNRNIEDLPVIYGFNNGGCSDFLSAELIAEDGTHMGGHFCSAEAYMPYDLGVLEGTKEDRHVGFRAHYPFGYRMEFVGKKEILKHAGLLEAYRLNQLMRKDS